MRNRRHQQALLEDTEVGGTGAGRRRYCDGGGDGLERRGGGGRRLHAAALALAAVLTLLIAKPTGATAAPASTATPRAGIPGAAYVALGDSYSAGEGLGGFEKGTDIDKGSKRNQCHRSAHDAYPVLRPPVVLPAVASRAFFACSGATAADMRRVPPKKGSTRQVGQPRQTATVGPGTQFISVSAGGNDVGFGDLGIACVQAIIDHKVTVHAPGGGSCAGQLKNADRKLATTRKELAGLYGDLLTAAPQATIAVLGYPRVLPSSYAGVPTLKGSLFCVLDHYPIPFLVTDVGMPVADAKKLDAFTVRLNATIQGAIDDVRNARPGQATQLRYADSYSSSVPRNCKGRTKNATVTAAQLTLGRGISGAKLKDKLKLLLATSTLHPTKAGQKMFAGVVQQAFNTTPLLRTDVVRQTPVTPNALIAPGFRVTESIVGDRCGEGSDIAAAAYRCFAGNGVYDPCYAVAEPGTGDAASVVCPSSPFTSDLLELRTVKGLGYLVDSSFDEPNGIELVGGAKCRASQGAHGTDGTGRVIDFYCDDNRTAVLRGLHKEQALWTADIVTYDASYNYSPAVNVPIVRAVLLQHDVPPANRPVTDAQNATTDELNGTTREHHEVDCGFEEAAGNDRISEEVFTSLVPCYEATLVVTEWDVGTDLESGWACEETRENNLLCQKGGPVASDNPAAFFAATHIRGVR